MSKYSSCDSFVIAGYSIGLLLLDSFRSWSRRTNEFTFRRWTLEDPYCFHNYSLRNLSLLVFLVSVVLSYWSTGQCQYSVWHAIVTIRQALTKWTELYWFKTKYFYCNWQYNGIFFLDHHRLKKWSCLVLKKTLLCFSLKMIHCSFLSSKKKSLFLQ